MPEFDELAITTDYENRYLEKKKLLDELETLIIWEIFI